MFSDTKFGDVSWPHSQNHGLSSGGFLSLPIRPAWGNHWDPVLASGAFFCVLVTAVAELYFSCCFYLEALALQRRSVRLPSLKANACASLTGRSPVMSYDHQGRRRLWSGRNKTEFQHHPALPSQSIFLCGINGLLSRRRTAPGQPTFTKTCTAIEMRFRWSRSSTAMLGHRIRDSPVKVCHAEIMRMPALNMQRSRQVE